MIERNNINIVLNFITGYLSIEKIPYAIVGGLSVIGYGLDRETDDIDIDVPDIYKEIPLGFKKEGATIAILQKDYPYGIKNKAI